MHNAPTLSPEGRARCVAWRSGCILETGAFGFSLIKPGSGRVIARNLSPDAIIDGLQPGGDLRAALRRPEEVQQ